MPASRALASTCLLVVVAVIVACTTPPREPPAVPAAPPPPAAAVPVVVPTIPSPFTASTKSMTSSMSTSRLLVLATASVQGYVEPCGCTGDPLGGVARLSALVDQARDAYGGRVLFVDAGDLLYEKPDDTAAVDRCQHESRTQLLVSSYARAGLAATTRGPLDDVRGAAARDELLARHGVPSVEGGRGVVVERAGVKALIVGVGADDAGLAIAQQTIASQRTAVDVVVVLAQRDIKGSRAVAAGLSGADVVIVGNAAEAPSPPERVGGAVVVQPGWQAQHVAAVDVVFGGRTDPSVPLALDDREAVRDGRKKLLDVRLAELDKLIASLADGATKQFQQQRRDRFAAERAGLDVADTTPLDGPHIAVRAIALRRGMAEDAVAAAALATYTAAIPRLVTQCEAGVVCEEPPPEVPRYVGVETCRACHASAVAFWEQGIVEVPATLKDGTKTTRRTGHVKAMETLVHDGRDQDRSCVGCHSAGFDLPGGACTTTALREKKLGGVQCESCHGPGSAHVLSGGEPRHISRVVPESRCRECHVPPHIPSVADFVYEERLLHVIGEGHGAGEARRLRQERTEKETP
jgi:hypothetical protein